MKRDTKNTIPLENERKRSPINGIVNLVSLESSFLERPSKRKKKERPDGRKKEDKETDGKRRKTAVGGDFSYDFLFFTNSWSSFSLTRLKRLGPFLSFSCF